jgi:hypothetical protein
MLGQTSACIINQHIDKLATLADYLLKKNNQPKSLVIVPFLGAGASASAGLPNSGALMRLIYDDVVGNDNGHQSFAQVLDDEAKHHFPEESPGVLCLSLFQFAAVLSRFAYARTKIHRAIKPALTQASHRPLVYELLAHLAKHEFVDHFVSVNFDLLLDDALDDEIPDRLCKIASSDELPGPLAARERESQGKCYLLKPFGSLSNDHYKLEVSEVKQYGSDSVWTFMLDSVFQRSTGKHFPDVVLVLIGYAAGEPAFAQLLSELLREESRKVVVFDIDSSDLAEPLHRLIHRVKNKQRLTFYHIPVSADDALDVLLQILEDKYRTDYPDRGWVSSARHRIISALKYNTITNAANRFKVELILQAMKSRGFFSIEVVADIERVRKYAANAPAVLAEMVTEGILLPQAWRVRSKTSPISNVRQDYVLIDDSSTLERKLLDMSSPPRGEYWHWRVDKKASLYSAAQQKTTFESFISERFADISTTPEIEVTTSASPATPWLFRNARPLTSIATLTEETAQLFKLFGEGANQFIPYGVWTTGEWLLHDKSWAWSTFGKQVIKLMNEKRLKLRLVLSKDHAGSQMRAKRSREVADRLKPFEQLKVCGEHGESCEKDLKVCDEEHNRIITLLRCIKADGRETARGIYMRRRLGTPLVSPVAVEDYADCNVLLELFEHYHAKANHSV